MRKRIVLAILLLVLPACGLDASVTKIRSGDIDYTDVTLVKFTEETPWRTFYVNAAGDFTELVFGANGQYLQSQGPAAIPIWAGGGVGEGNTASNTGTQGTGIYKQKVGIDLEFYKIASANARLVIALVGVDYIGLTIDTDLHNYSWLNVVDADIPDTITVGAAGSVNDAAIPAAICRDAEVPGLETDANHDQISEITATWGTGLTLAGDTVDVDDSYLLNTGDSATGSYTFDGGTVRIDSGGHKLGVGTVAPAAQLDVMSTTEQLRLSFDAANVVTFTVDATGDMVLNVGGSDLDIIGSVSSTHDFLAPLFQSVGDLTIRAFSGGANTRVSVENTGGAKYAWLDVEAFLQLGEINADPPEPAEGKAVIWMSDGTGKGDDGDVLIASKAGGVTKWTTLFDHSAGNAW